MTDWPAHGGRWLQRTADNGTDDPEPEYQYVLPDNWPCRVVVSIVDTDAPEPKPMEDHWDGPDWAAGASVSDFIRHLSPDIWRRLVSLIAAIAASACSQNSFFDEHCANSRAAM